MSSQVPQCILNYIRDKEKDRTRNDKRERERLRKNKGGCKEKDMKHVMKRNRKNNEREGCFARMHFSIFRFCVCGASMCTDKIFRQESYKQQHKGKVINVSKQDTHIIITNDSTKKLCSNSNLP